VSGGELVDDSTGGEVQVELVRGLGARQVDVDAQQGAGHGAAGCRHGQVLVQCGTGRALEPHSARRGSRSPAGVVAAEQGAAGGDDPPSVVAVHQAEPVAE
jgi:hypothetical protein